MVKNLMLERDLEYAAKRALSIRGCVNDQREYESEQDKIGRNLLLLFSKASLTAAIYLFDDAMEIIKKERIASAGALARSMIEIVGFLCLLCEAVEKIDQNDDCATNELVRKFAFSSRLLDEIKNKKGPKGISPTAEAKILIERGDVNSVHVLNGIRAGGRFLKNSGRDDSGESFQIIYAKLCEITHPSVSSITNIYTNIGESMKSDIFGQVSSRDRSKLDIYLALSQIWIADYIFGEFCRKFA
jgi:hypothetical protein